MRKNFRNSPYSNYLMDTHKLESVDFMQRKRKATFCHYLQESCKFALQSACKKILKPCNELLLESRKFFSHVQSGSLLVLKNLRYLYNFAKILRDLIYKYKK